MGKLNWIKNLKLKNWPSTRKLGKNGTTSSSNGTSSSSANEPFGSSNLSLESEQSDSSERIPDPHPILSLGHMFAPSRILLVAVEWELFTVLAAAKGGEMTHIEIRETLGLHPRATPDFVDALVALKMLKKRKDPQRSDHLELYSNTPETGLFLDKARPETYVGEPLEECSRTHYVAWDDHGNFLKDKSRQVKAVRQVIQACNLQAQKQLLKASGCAQQEKLYKANAIFELGFGFWKSRLLLTAIEWRLFSNIEAAPKACLNVSHVQNLYGIRHTVAQEFLDSLVDVGMLQKRKSKNTDDKDDPIYYYTNTPDGAIFLDFLKPTYMGARMEYCSEELYRYWSKLPDALKTGQQQTDLPHKGPNDRYSILYQDEERTSTCAYMNAYGIGHGLYSTAVQILDFSNYKTLIDIGGSSGQFACYIAQRNPHIQCLSADLPQIQPIAERMIPDWDCQDQVTAISLDCFEEEEFPKVDAVVWGMMLSEWNLERKQLLIQKAFDALPIGGALFALESYIDDDRNENFLALCVSLQALLDTGANGGSCFTFGEYKEWCLEAGFARVEFQHILGPLSAGIAYKE